MKFKTKAMPKKKAAGAGKKAPKKKAPRDGSSPNALGLEGPGVEVIEIPEVSAAIAKYKRIMTARVKLTAEEVPAKEAVVSEMSKHADKLRDPKTGTLKYHIDDKHYVEITPSKVQIKFREDKPKKTAKTPEQSAKVEDGDQQDASQGQD